MIKHRNRKKTLDHAIQIIRDHNGLIRMSDAMKSGITSYSLYSLRDNGFIQQIARGIFQLTDTIHISNPDFAVIALKIPKAVICLISALSFYEITNQIPHEIFIALKKGTETPRLDYPPIAVHRFSDPSFESGIEEYDLDGIQVRIYSIEKTLVDCFKFRKIIGMDVVLEALKLYKLRKKVKPDDLLKYAHICRVEKSIKPYMEAIF